MNSNTTFYTGTIRYIASPMLAAHTRRDDYDWIYYLLLGKKFASDIGDL
jgi:hypothetical protein